MSEISQVGSELPTRANDPRDVHFNPLGGMVGERRAGRDRKSHTGINDGLHDRDLQGCGPTSSLETLSEPDYSVGHHLLVTAWICSPACDRLN